MSTVKEIEILTNFNLTIILPFFLELNTCKKVLKENVKYFQRNGIEVVIIINKKNKSTNIIKFIKNYPFINWKLLLLKNRDRFENVSNAINVGVRNSTKDYIMIMFPDKLLCTDMIYNLRITLKYCYNSYAVSTHLFKYFGPQKPSNLIMIKKEDMIKINGCDESFKKWNECYNNIKTKLELIGKKILIIDKMKLSGAVEANQDKIKFKIYNNFSDKNRINLIGNLKEKNITINKLIYDWHDNKFSEELIKKYLSEFLKFEMRGNIFEKRYKIISMVQSYNESEYIEKSLEKLSEYCDGIILLDDNSNDRTYEIIDLERYPKLLLKVQKKRMCFNDLENKNILLNIVSFFNTDWVYFIDVDERFDSRYANIYQIIDKEDIDIIIFKLAHLWDNEETYRTDYPGSDELGLKSIWRMFRNKGRMQIFSSKRLHFLPIPYLGNIFFSQILILHYGMLKKEKRYAKYKFYLAEDANKDQLNYTHIIEEKVKLKRVSEIKM